MDRCKEDPAIHSRTVNYGLIFSADDSNNLLVGYSDADWAGDFGTCHSTSGFVFQIQSNTVSWCNKRQPTVSKSSTESEYIALSGACQEAVWLRLLADIGLEQKGPSTIYEDNEGAIELTKNPRFHNRTKHIDVSFHYTREQVNLKTVSVKYCPTDLMLADIMTKGRLTNRFSYGKLFLHVSSRSPPPLLRNVPVSKSII